MADKTTKRGPFDCAAFYTITSKLSGKAVTACGDTEVRMFTLTGEDNQQWKLAQADSGAYRLISKATGKALDIILAGENDGAQLHQWEDISAPTQSWRFEQTQDGSYKLKSSVSGKCLDIVDISALDDARLQIWEDLDGENQKWALNALPATKSARNPRTPKKESAAGKRDERRGSGHRNRARCQKDAIQNGIKGGPIQKNTEINCLSKPPMKKACCYFCSRPFLRILNAFLLSIPAQRLDRRHLCRLTGGIYAKKDTNCA